MRKVIFIFTLFVLFLILALMLYKKYAPNNKEERIYSVLSSYSYLSDGEVNFKIKVYTNKEESLLAYPKNAKVYLHDAEKKNIIDCNITNYLLNSSGIYTNDYFYEYLYELRLSITELYIEECYFSLEFENKTYEFQIGNFEIVNGKYSSNEVIQISNLFGLTNDNLNKSLAGIVIKFKNITDKEIILNSINLNKNYKVTIKEENICELKDTTDIYSYMSNYTKNMTNISEEIYIPSKGEIAIFLPITYLKDYYLSNAFLEFEINKNTYYYPNFTFIDSSDLSSMDSYVVSGIIYGF